MPNVLVAAPGDCVNSEQNHDPVSRRGLRRFKVNPWDAVNAGLIDSNSASQLAMLAAGNWNEQSNGGTYRFVGTTIDSDLPADLSQCNNLGIDYSLVVYTNDCNSLHGQAIARCSGRQFVVKIYPYNSSCQSRNHGNAAVAQGTYDYAGLLTHEFGHTQGLGHPTNGEEATLKPGLAAPHRRSLYQWDLKCSFEITGRRQVTTYKRTHSASGFSPEQYVTRNLSTIMRQPVREFSERHLLS